MHYHCRKLKGERYSRSVQMPQAACAIAAERSGGRVFRLSASLKHSRSRCRHSPRSLRLCHPLLTVRPPTANPSSRKNSSRLRTLKARDRASSKDSLFKKVKLCLCPCVVLPPLKPDYPGRNSWCDADEPRHDRVKGVIDARHRIGLTEQHAGQHRRSPTCDRID